MGYEIGPTQDPLDYPAKAERIDYKTDCVGSENLAEASSTCLGKAMKNGNRSLQLARIWAGQGSFLMMSERHRSLARRGLGLGCLGV